MTTRTEVNTVFQQKAIHSFENVLNATCPLQLKETLRSMYNAYVRSDLFIENSISDFQCLEDLMDDIIDAKPLFVFGQQSFRIPQTKRKLHDAIKETLLKYFKPKQASKLTDDVLEFGFKSIYILRFDIFDTVADFHDEVKAKKIAREAIRNCGFLAH